MLLIFNKIKELRESINAIIQLINKSKVKYKNNSDSTEQGVHH